MVFAVANEENGYSLKYKKKLQDPPRILIRQHERERGEQLYSAEQIHKLVEAAEPELLKPGDLCLTYSGQFHLPEVMQRLGERLTYFWLFAVECSGKHSARVP